MIIYDNTELLAFGNSRFLLLVYGTPILSDIEMRQYAGINPVLKFIEGMRFFMTELDFESDFT